MLVSSRLEARSFHAWKPSKPHLLQTASTSATQLSDLSCRAALSSQWLEYLVGRTGSHFALPYSCPVCLSAMGAVSYALLSFGSDQERSSIALCLADTLVNRWLWCLGKRHS
mmetsp:Transcript_35988/g.82443  ORF Transcript_35988/g.82443 Transcript_35988/m.82443 type:complete len:112 (-) Transcript_35988:242-577(-)